MHPVGTRAPLAALLIATALLLQGCGALGFGGAMIESYRRSSTKTVKAEYTKLKDERFAVIVNADRVIQGEHPDLVNFLTEQITQRLVDNQKVLAASGYIPPDKLLGYLYDNPNWIGRPRGQLAKDLGVERLVFVEVIEYQLNDPGNSYLWSGKAVANVSVIEADGPLPDQAAFERSIRVTFPDTTGISQSEMEVRLVNSVLASRLADRAAWLFYTHEEPYYPKY